MRYFGQQNGFFFKIKKLRITKMKKDKYLQLKIK